MITKNKSSMLGQIKVSSRFKFCYFKLLLSSDKFEEDVYNVTKLIPLSHSKLLVNQ